MFFDHTYRTEGLRTLLRGKGKFKRPEAATLEALCLAFFGDITFPAEEEVVIPQEQTSWLKGSHREDTVEVEEDEA